ncbi:MAG: radical SAM protein [Elusimicrobia bacterium]|nr:radical SAM protein [Elusimicrobiota bacterium]
MGARDYSGSLMVMLTYACQMRCAYCGVRNRPVHMGWETLRRGLDLLFTAPRQDLQLRYFGGEPLLRFGLIQKAVDHAGRSGRSVRHMITTNGLLLDAKKLSWLSGRDVEIMFSLDGLARTHRHRRIIANLRALQKSGLPYFVNFVVEPGGHEQAKAELDWLAGQGVRRVQVGYQVGTLWSPAQQRAYLDLLRRVPAGLDLLNRHNQAEPVMLSDEAIVDTDGKVYFDAALFVERFFPRLRRTMLLGRLDEGLDLARLERTRAEVLRRFKRAYPPSTAKGRLFLNNLGLGLAAGRLMERA